MKLRTLNMHFTRLSGVVCGLALLCAGSACATPAGEAAPAFSLPARTASEPAVELAQFKGQVVLLDFWASWCGPCRQSFPWLTQLQARLGARGLRVVGINVDRQRSAAEQFLAQVPAGFTLAFDAAGEVARRYAVQGMPSSVLVGADGRVLLQHTGFRDADRALLEAAVVDALQRAGR